MQGELKSLQRRVGITFVLVTHDQDEALGMADRVAVFDSGRVEQVGTPEEVYEAPATAFVAGFVGAANILDAAAVERLAGRRQAVALRPERIAVDAPAGPDDLVADATVEGARYYGASTRFDVLLDVGGVRLVVDRANAGDGQQRPALGSRVRLSWPRSAMRPLREAGP
jgi:putative spermidine/putrescine transport system ATP-binding protein